MAATTEMLHPPLLGPPRDAWRGCHTASRSVVRAEGNVHAVEPYRKTVGSPGVATGRGRSHLCPNPPAHTVGWTSLSGAKTSDGQDVHIEGRAPGTSPGAAPSARGCCAARIAWNSQPCGPPARPPTPARLGRTVCPAWVCVEVAAPSCRRLWWSHGAERSASRLLFRVVASACARCTVPRCASTCLAGRVDLCRVGLLAVVLATHARRRGVAGIARAWEADACSSRDRRGVALGRGGAGTDGRRRPGRTCPDRSALGAVGDLARAGRGARSLGVTDRGRP